MTPAPVYVVTYQPGRFWDITGPHGDDDLAGVYRELSVPQPVVLELTVPAQGSPTVENVTAKAACLATGATT